MWIESVSEDCGAGKKWEFRMMSNRGICHIAHDEKICFNEDEQPVTECHGGGVVVWLSIAMVPRPFFSQSSLGWNWEESMEDEIERIGKGEEEA